MTLPAGANLIAQCPGCQRFMPLPAAGEGKRARCRVCGAEFVVESALATSGVAGSLDPSSLSGALAEQLCADLAGWRRQEDVWLNDVPEDERGGSALLCRMQSPFPYSQPWRSLPFPSRLIKGWVFLVLLKGTSPEEALQLARTRHLAPVAVRGVEKAEFRKLDQDEWTREILIIFGGFLAVLLFATMVVAIRHLSIEFTAWLWPLPIESQAWPRLSEDDRETIALGHAKKAAATHALVFALLAPTGAVLWWCGYGWLNATLRRLQPNQDEWPMVLRQSARAAKAGSRGNARTEQVDHDAVHDAARFPRRGWGDSRLKSVLDPVVLRRASDPEIEELSEIVIARFKRTKSTTQAFLRDRDERRQLGIATAVTDQRILEQLVELGRLDTALRNIASALPLQAAEEAMIHARACASMRDAVQRELAIDEAPDG